MKVLVTGSNGFIGKNLIAELKNQGYVVLPFDSDSAESLLDQYCLDADFVFHLAGVNRPKDDSDYMEGNLGLTSKLLKLLEKYSNKSPIMLASSTQANLDNPYGQSKRASEEVIFKYASDFDVKVLVYRFPNIYGKWSKPNYNSVVATFCHNISRKHLITINDPNTVINLVYIDDVINELIRCLTGNETRNGEYCEVKEISSVALGKLSDLIHSFYNSRNTKLIPNLSDSFTRNLYSTYLSFLPNNEFSYPLTTHYDNRGSFTEFIKTTDCGQVSVNISKPGITKGNHWHHSKNEKFLVVAGKGIVRFRSIYSSEIIEYQVNSDKLDVIDIPVGYTHNLENTGDIDMVTIMWASESFDPNRPDTFTQEV